MKPDPPGTNESIDWSLTTWEGSRREQLRRWAELPLESAILAVEEMQALAKRILPEAQHVSEVREAVASRYRPGTVDLRLPGCTPEPLMSYLKSLGILRLVSEQKCSAVRGWWRNDLFWLRSALDRDALVNFFLAEYRPTPIVAPWAGGSGFFPRDNRKAVMQLAGSSDPRVAAYGSVIRRVQAILTAEKIADKPKDDDKKRLLRRYRSELPEEVVAWMDAAMVVHDDGQRFAPLLGTGGNDGRLDFTQNFMQHILALGLHDSRDGESGDLTVLSKAWLTQALFSTPGKLTSASIGQFAPGRAGGPNATQGLEGDSAVNPWDFILMMEGTLVLAGAAARRFGVVEAPRAGFPFTVDGVAAGFGSAASMDEAASRGELWLPLWNRPAGVSEVRQLFSEGRAQVAGRMARDATDFARAVACLGVDRGIAAFSRVGFLKRSGKAFLATPLGRFAVAERCGVELLREIDPWLDRFRRAAEDRNAPPRFSSALWRLDSAVFEFCKHGGGPFFQRIGIALGQAERQLAVTPGKLGQSKGPPGPLTGLSPDWVREADDGSREFDVALALAGVHDPEGKLGPLRSNLEPVDWRNRCRGWAEKDRTVVWNAGDLVTNLTNVLQRRLIDGVRAGCERLPLWSRWAAPLDAVTAFIAGDLEDERVEDLLWGLMLVEGRRSAGAPRSSAGEKLEFALLPRRDYALLKLLFLPKPLVPMRSGDEVVWRLARKGEPGLVIRPEPRILPLLKAGRIGEACRIAAWRLRACGLSPMPGPRPNGLRRDEVWSGAGSTLEAGHRLAAALLIPVASRSINRLVHLACRAQDSASAQALVASTEGETV